MKQENSPGLRLLGVRNGENPDLNCHGIPGWWLTYPSEKYELSDWIIIPRIGVIGENKKCSKPPTSIPTVETTSASLFVGSFSAAPGCHDCHDCHDWTGA